MFTAIAFYEFCYSVRRYMQMVYLQDRKGFQDLYLYVYKFKEFQDRISSKHVQSKLGFFYGNGNYNIVLGIASLV